ncbi:hypothetical protein PQX77_007950, partial [Marasmius sp. AFHP31]
KIPRKAARSSAGGSASGMARPPPRRSSRLNNSSVPGAFEEEEQVSFEEPRKEKVKTYLDTSESESDLSPVPSSSENEVESILQEDQSLLSELLRTGLSLREEDIAFNSREGHKLDFPWTKQGFRYDKKGYHAARLLHGQNQASDKYIRRAKGVSKQDLEQRRKKALAKYKHRKRKVYIVQSNPPPIEEMTEPEHMRESWRDLTKEQTDQVASEKGRSHKFPEGFQGSSEDEWLCFFDDIEATFLAKGITMDEAKIFCAIRSMCYALRKEVETLEASKGRSWADFKRAIEKGWAVNAEYGSQEALRRVVEEFAPMSLQVSEVRFNAFVRRFQIEANKLLKPPALLSNKTLVDTFLKTFDAFAMKAILDGLQMMAQLRAQQGVLAEDELDRRKQDPYKLEEVISQAELVEHLLREEERKLQNRWYHAKFRQGTLKIASPSQNAASTSPPEDDIIGKVMATVDLQAVQLKGIKSEMEQYQVRMKENFDRSERVLEEKMIDIRKLIMNPGPRETGKVASYSEGYSKPASTKTGTPMIAKGPPTCWMCDAPGHTTINCDVQKDFFKKGWLKKDASGKIWLYDNTGLPFVRPGDTKKRYELIIERAMENRWPNAFEEDPTASMYASAEEVFEVVAQPGTMEHPLYYKELTDTVMELKDAVVFLVDRVGSNESKN